MGRNEVIHLMLLAGRLRGLSAVMEYALPEPLFHGRPMSEVLNAEADALIALLPPQGIASPKPDWWVGKPS